MNSSSNTSNDTNNTTFIMINNEDEDENEDEIKRYSKDKEDGNGHDTIIAVFEGDYVRFAKELDNSKLGEEKIVSQEEFEKMIKREEWRKEREKEKDDE
jgi:hypothetical protein